MTTQTEDNSEDKVPAWVSEPFRIEGHVEGKLDADGAVALISYMTPKDYTWKEFQAAFEQACYDAWVPDVQSMDAVELPVGVFPGVTQLINPITREAVPVRRADPFIRRPHRRT